MAIDSGWFNLPVKSVPSVPSNLVTGKFISPEGTTIFRSATKQVETFNDGNSSVTSNVEWINNFEFKLTCEAKSNAYGNIQVGDVTHVKIIKWDDTRYFCHFTNKSGSRTGIYYIVK